LTQRNSPVREIGQCCAGVVAAVHELRRSGNEEVDSGRSSRCAGQDDREHALGRALEIGRRGANTLSGHIVGFGSILLKKDFEEPDEGGTNVLLLVLETVSDDCICLD
jgi:hypothetical protein